VPIAIVLALASALLLANLGDQRLWQDEAQTALIAGTVLTHGVPLGTDGVNSFSQDRGQDVGHGHLWLWHPWLPFYVLAACFALLGKSTLAARLPFALFGIGTVFLTAWLARTLWRSGRSGFFAGLALALNVPFLILSRQSRYYAPDMLFAVLGLLAYQRLLEGRRHATLLFVLSTVALFQCHYVHYAALMATVVLHMLVFRRGRLRPVLIATAVSAALVLPWAIWFSSSL